MGIVGNSIIEGIKVKDIVTKLDSFHAYENVAVQWIGAVKNRLGGQAAYLLPGELDSKAAQAQAHADKLASRVAQLGGAVSGDPHTLVEVAGVDRFELPEDTSSVSDVLTHVLEYERQAIVNYSEFLGDIRNKDVITYQLLVDILRDKVETEDEIESVVAR